LAAVIRLLNYLWAAAQPALLYGMGADRRFTNLQLAKG